MYLHTLRIGSVTTHLTDAAAGNAQHWHTSHITSVKMEDLRRTGGGDDPAPPNLTPSLSGATRNDIVITEIIQNFYNMFMATFEVEYLEISIGLAEGLAPSHKELRPTLNALLEMRDFLRERNKYIETANAKQKNSGEQGAGPNQTLKELEVAKTIRSLYTIFATTGDISYLGNAIGIAEELAASASPGKLNPDSLLTFTCLLRARCRWTEGLEDIEKAIKWMEVTVAEIPPGHPNRVVELERLSEVLFGRYEKYRALGDLEQAIKRTSEVVAAAPLEDPDRARMLINLSTMLESRYDRLGDLQDLEQAIMWRKEAITATPPGHPDRAGMLSNLGNLLGSRYKRLGDLQDLEQAIIRCKEAVAATPSDHPDRAGMLNNLGNRLGDRFDWLGDLQDLEQAILRSKEAVAASFPGHPNRAVFLVNLGNRLGKRYKRLGDLEDLEQAIIRAREAIASTRPDHPSRGEWLSNLGDWLGCRYQRLGDLQDLEQAILRCKEAVMATPSDGPYLAERLNSLGNWLESRYDRLGDLQDLEQAIKRAREAIAATPPDYPNRTGMLKNLGAMLGSRYKRLGDPQDLKQAITRTKQAITATPRNHSSRPVRLGSLGTMLYTGYDRVGDLQDLEQAIIWTEEAVMVAPSGHPDRAGMLNSLGMWFGSRYKLLGDLQDLEQAIMLAKEAIMATPPDFPAHASILVGLGTMLGFRYSRFGDLQDLELAIMRTEEAVAATPLDHPDRAGMLSNLGKWLCIRYDLLGGLHDLEKGIMWAEEVIVVTPSDHPDRAGMLSNYGMWLGYRYKQWGDLQDLEQAIIRGEEAVAATPPGHFERVLRLGLLIDSLTLKYKQTGSAQVFVYILRISYEAWYCKVAAPKVKILIIRNASLLLASRRIWQESSALLEEAVKMLPRVSPRSLGRDDQEHHLSNFTRLAAETVSISFQAGKEAAHSLRLLELGRGIITGLVIDCRSDLSELQSKKPELFNKFNQLRIEVDSPLVRIVDNDRHIHQQGRRRREKAIEELEETLSSIRQLPGFREFQLPPRTEDLMAIAGEGPIVIFNSTQFRSDAIIVTSSAVKALALPKLLYPSVEEQMSQLRLVVQGRRSTYQRRNKVMREILLWLWDVAVEPVFNVLQQDTAIDTTCSGLPRIWWIGVGPLAMAPFHAAGDHSPGSTRNTISRAISSYIPTIKSLSYARQKKLELLSRPDSRLLLVTMPTTPAENPHKPPSLLKNVTKEVEQIADIVNGKTITTQLHCPSTAQVIAELPSYHAIHFACHGVSDSRSPSNSHLILCKDDGSEYGAPDKLTVGAISNTNIKQAQIAYLSACSTAENVSASLLDESIHIASGFQLAGFSHVLATQWVSKDGACLKVAGDFYSSLFSGQHGDEEGHRRVSAAFHYAVKNLRDENAMQPILWAPYIHTGA